MPDKQATGGPISAPTLRDDELDAVCAALEQMEAGLTVLDASGRLVYANAAAARLVGYDSAAALIAATAPEVMARFELIGVDGTPFPAEQLPSRLAFVGRSTEAVIRFRPRGDGADRWSNVRSVPVLDGSGKVTRVVTFFGDVTTQRQEEIQRELLLHEATRSQTATEESFRLMVAGVKDYAIFRLSPQGIVSTWNAGAELIKGYRADEIIGSHFSRFYRAEEVRAGKCELELEIASREGRFEEEGWRVRKDGTEFWANVVITAVIDAQGRITGFVKVTRDLTERRRAEEERAARLAAEQANRAKDEFLALLGHELRNPLAPIVTALELLKQHGTADSKEHQIIERQVRHMTRLVNDLLDVSRIVMGKVELVRQELDLRAVVAKAVEIASPLLEQRQQHFELLQPASEIWIEGDEARLAQVFANLITNAAKYTAAHGHVVVTVECDESQAKVEVRDDGAGISRELLPRIFNLFVQGPQTPERAGGLGIGLSVVRSLLDMHGGTVSVKSGGVGLGSAFTVSLPALAGPRAAPMPSAGRAPRIQADQPKRILLVDDNQDASELMAELLRSAGHTVATALEGPSALRLLEELEPEVAVVDIGLPVMDGYDLAARIQAQLGSAAPLLIALSGYGQERDRSRSMAAGFRLHLLKPVDADQLLDAIAGLTGPAA